MQSVKSCFNRTLFGKNITRFWPIWALYGAVWVLLFPTVIFSCDQWTPELAQELPLELLPFGGLVMAAGFGVLCAMAVFSYLYNIRAVGMLHALPLRRVDLFCTNFLSGLAFMILPNLAVFLLSLLAELLCGAVDIGSLCMWLVVQCLLYFFFYAFAVFCAMFTGHILALPAFYGILNILASGLVLLFQHLAQEFIFGFVGLNRLEETALLFTPLLKLASTIRVRYLEDRGAAFYGLHLVLLYAFVGVIFTILALVVYEKRHLETAGEVVTVPWVKPVFKYGVAFCAAITFGTFLYRITGLPQGPWTLLILLLLCGCAGYYAAEMLLRKSFRVIRDGWKGCAAVVLCLIAAVCTMEFDLAGFERRVPDPGRVVSAWIDCPTMPYDGISDGEVRLTQPEELALLAQVHQAAVDSKNVPYSYQYTDVDGVSVATHSTAALSITYELEDGSILQRRYETLPISQAELSDPGSLTSLLTALVNQPAVIERSYFPLRIFENARLVDAEVTRLYGENGSGGSREDYEGTVVPSAALPELLEAVHSDIAAGRLGRRYLMVSQDRMDNCYLSDLRLVFRVYLGTEDGETHPNNTSVTIGLEASATDTLSVLEKYGVITDSASPITHAEKERQDRAAEANTSEIDGGWEYVDGLS